MVSAAYHASKQEVRRRNEERRRGTKKKKIIPPPSIAWLCASTEERRKIMANALGHNKNNVPRNGTAPSDTQQKLRARRLKAVSRKKNKIKRKTTKNMARQGGGSHSEERAIKRLME